MKNRKRDRHDAAPEKSPAALLLIDVVNDFDFPEAEQLLQFALPMAERIAELKRAAAKHHVPVVYVNDNFGRWRSDLNAQVDHCMNRGGRAREIVELLRPEQEDYFVLKPKHSGFFSTSLDTLLEYLGVHTLVLCGVATNICVLFTANDAYMRDLRLFVPRDCVASNTLEENQNALEQMRVVLKADIAPSTELRFDHILSPQLTNP